MSTIRPITPCLWFDDQAEEAVNFYTGIFKNSKINETTHYTEIGQEFHGKQPGTVMTVEFELNGQPFTALNGGPIFQFSEAISFQIDCKDQQEVDYYWEKLSAGGDPKAQQCGWLKDKFNISWQVVPAVLPDLIRDQTSESGKRAMAAMFQMKKLDIAALEKAYNGA